MRVVGNSQIALPQLTPSSTALQQAAIHQATAMALMRVASNGVRKGIYRYASLEAANRASEEAQVVAMLLNVPPIASTS